MKDKKTQARRYKLHYRIRKQGFTLNTKQRTIYLRQWKGGGQCPSKQVLALKNEYNYVVQLIIADLL